MKFLADIIVQTLKWVLPLFVSELIAYIKKVQAEKAEVKHEKAMEDLKNAQDEEAIKEATREIAKNP